ncbi:helix-turn-helix domain-containing protein [Haloechinothrix salitolerans]|uniref:Helix-turn-helix domain-containing protein n=1 Tax=Haloechinothrix salitolerans TaxID=926830 RepID=A0ABW2BX05_9PSEU
MTDVVDRPVTVRELLRLEELAGYEISGNEDRLDREVRDVVVALLGGGTPIGRGALVVAAYRRSSGYEAELLLRKADTGGAVAVMLTGASRLMLSTRRLAERLGMPLLALPDSDPVHLAWRVSRHVHDPERFSTVVLSRLLRRLRTPVTKPDELITMVNTELGASAALLSSDGAVVAGDRPDELPAALFERPVPQAVDVADGHLLCAPVFVEDVRHPELWLIARIPPSHQYWTEGTLQALSAAASAGANWAARQRLASERDARDRSTLLSELIDTGGAIPRHLAERAVRAGWRLDGWHTGVHIRVLSDPASIVRHTGRVRRALNDNGFAGPVVERTDGWSCWATDNREPRSASYRDTTAAIRKAIDDVAEADALDVVAGVGRPYAGPRGISTTLREAREACLFADATSRNGRVEHVDELGVRRVLADWYHAEAFRSYARTLLAPLLDAGEDQLVETLRTYLELESSTSSAAAALRVHRNTVMHRIGRIEQLLSMSLSRPDERLVLQLACRVLRGGEERVD